MIPPLHTHSLVPDILAWGLLLAHKGVFYTMRGFGVAKRILANLSNQGPRHLQLDYMVHIHSVYDHIWHLALMVKFA